MKRIGVLSTVALVSLPAGVAATAAASVPYKDIRVGEADDISRIEIICAAPCEASLNNSGDVLLKGVSGELDLDLAPSGGYVTALKLLTATDGSRLVVTTKFKPYRIATSSCTTGSICIDLYQTPPAELPSETKKRKALRGEEQPAVPVSTRIQEPQAVERLRVAPKVYTQWNRQFAASLQPVSPRPLSQHECERSKSSLVNDAWDLVSFKIVALCKAALGEPDEAMLLLERLAKIEPEDDAVQAALQKLSDLTSSPKQKRFVRN